MGPKYELHYFNLQGRAEVTRLLFHHAGVKYDDIMYDRADWPAIKGDAERFPLSQMPVLKVDGEKICHSNAINNYLANEFGLNGATNLQSVIIDQVNETLLEVFQQVAGIMMNKDLTAEEKNKLFMELFAKETTVSLLTFVENLLKRNNGGAGYFVGESISYADINFLQFSNLLPKPLLERFNLLNDLVTRVKESPNIKAYIAARTIPLN